MKRMWLSPPNLKPFNTSGSGSRDEHRGVAMLEAMGQQLIGIQSEEAEPGERSGDRSVEEGEIRRPQPVLGASLDVQPGVR